MINVLVTGGNGQLGASIKSIQKNYPSFNFAYTDYEDLDITDLDQLSAYFQSNSFQYCINCAAYTAVDKAETETELAERINALAAYNLAKMCKDNNITLIHISTDFVFEGNQSSLYKETDQASPISVYGSTKLEGEKQITKTLQNYFILRTSWLYSEFGNNFMKTMIRLANDRDELNIVADQIGTPTYAPDLADVICKIMDRNSKDYGIYHYSNEGIASWYDFAKAIFDLNNNSIIANPITTEQYPTPAKRPAFSVMDKSKIKKTFNLSIPYWRDSLKVAIKKYNEQQS